MIDTEDFVLTDRGLLRAGEVESNMKVLGLRPTTGSLTWSTVESSTKHEGDAIRVYGDQSEFSLFDDTVVIVHGRGPCKLYKDVMSSNIYSSDFAIETVTLDDKSLDKVWVGNQESEGNAQLPDLTQLGFLARRLPLKDKIVIRIPKGRFDQISHLFSSLKPSIYEGEYWDWVKLESQDLLKFAGESWSEPQTIPRIIRESGYANLKAFFHGLMLATHYEESGFFLHKTFEYERDLRAIMYFFMSITGTTFLADARPLYCPDQVVLSVVQRSTRVNSINASKSLGRILGVTLQSEHVDWYPVVNLSLIA